ncbi:MULTISPECIES: YafY family protein [unclassified Paenibacillus]|uniref:helix-turn-helix transcriptional regulator n=1 Tax=unclassified Paenibacillus TaxID=185978 RepID=UPI000953C8C0|nr:MULTISPECIES: YafY family protein [unclassified Paenibacillus]ASS67517.1 YafY family transcriptional regulator [Paenibacillus sp. RUD330]SIQ74232.1 Predicted DNA-binding transcriptional regulator YafY, contains an HTH and WYL domains [Paenibacillus sp. RU4X]SIQ95658.1 Predicted DNA-binding transcriptional regulator YafY, contains an HTH and WYL domains [Paenibacillus sp. RU4T]
MKIDRLLAITVLLLNRGRISAKELAERFEVSTKTIYRDIDSLNLSGIPIVTFKGVSGGFEIMEGYTMDRQFLTREEIGALASAVNGMKSALDDGMLAVLLDKVKALVGKSGRSPSSSEAVMFDFNPWGQSGQAREKLLMLRHAADRMLKVEIQYVDRNGSGSERVIEPANLIMKAGIWYVRSFCLLENEIRVFRLSRIRELRLLPEHFRSRELPLLDKYEWDREWSKDKETDLILEFHPDARHRVEDSFPSHLVHPDADGRVTVAGRLAVDEWFYGMLLSYGEHVKVIEPEFVAEELVFRVRKIIGLYAK